MIVEFIDSRLRPGAWTALLLLTALIFLRERRRDPSFIPPPSPPANSGVSYSGVTAADEERYADKQESQSYFPTYDTPAADHGYGRPNDTAMSRPSLDPYGAFAGDMLGRGRNERVEEPSRTMQLAYDDPCE